MFTGIAWPGGKNPPSVVQRVVHRLHAAVGLAADNDVAHVQRAVLHEHFRDDAAFGFLLSFEAGAHGRPIWICFVFVQLGHGEQRFQQLIDAGAFGGAGFDDFHVAAPLAWQQLVGGEAVDRRARY